MSSIYRSLNIYGSVIYSLFFSGLLVFATLLASTYDILTYNFENLMPTLKLAITSVLILNIFVAAILHYGIRNNQISTRKLWVPITLLFMVSAFVVGVAFLNDYIGKPNLDSILRENGNIIGEIDCESNSKTFSVNQTVTCNFKPQLHNYTSNITFTFIDGDTATNTTYDKISFTSPDKTKRIAFNIVGTDEKGNKRNFAVGRGFTFYTQEEAIKRNDTLIAYLIGLVGIIAFSIPSMMVNFRTLFSEN